MLEILVTMRLSLDKVEGVGSEVVVMVLVTTLGGGIAAGGGVEATRGEVSFVSWLVRT